MKLASRKSCPSQWEALSAFIACFVRIHVAWVQAPVNTKSEGWKLVRSWNLREHFPTTPCSWLPCLTSCLLAFKPNSAVLLFTAALPKAEEVLRFNPGSIRVWTRFSVEHHTSVSAVVVWQMLCGSFVTWLDRSDAWDKCCGHRTLISLSLSVDPWTVWGTILPGCQRPMLLDLP
jgi:hypothetical protein